MQIRAFAMAAVALAAAAASAPAGAQSVTSAPPPSENLLRLQAQVNDLDGRLKQEVSRNERLDIELRRAKAENARLQRMLDDALAQQGGAPGQAAASAPPTSQPAPRAAVTPPAAAAGQLGTLPADAAPGEAARAFAEARRLLMASRWADSETALLSFLAAHPASPDTPEARYFLGRTQNVLGKYGEAAATFVDFLRRSPNAARAPEAWVSLGVALRGMGETQRACATFRDLPVKYPNASAAVRAQAADRLRETQCPAR